MSKIRVLLVDDEDTIRLFLEKTLREEGYEALTAATGGEALELTRSELPDLILLDLKLPDISGLDVLQQIKETVPEVTVIMLTAFGDIETAVSAMKRGAFDFVSKPVNLEQLLIETAKELDRNARLLVMAITWLSEYHAIVEVESDAANERAGIGGWRGFEFFGVEASENEAVDFVFGPIGICKSG